MPAAEPISAAIWLDAQRVELVRRLLDAMGKTINVISIGGETGGEVHDLARELNIDRPNDDPRTFCNTDAKCILMATTAGMDGPSVDQAIADGINVITLAPIDHEVEAAVNRLRNTTRPSDATPGHLLHAGLFRHSPAWQAAANPLEVIEQVHAVRFASQADAEVMSIWRQLYDAWDAVLAVADVPEAITATIISPTSDRATNPRHITGHLAIHAQIGDDCLAAIHLTDTDPNPARQLDVFGAGGHITANDAGYELVDATGSSLDQTTLKNPVDIETQIATEWKQLIDQTIKFDSEPPSHEAKLLACCQTTLLACRTAAIERPDLLMKIATTA